MSQITDLSKDTIDWRKSSSRAVWWSFGIAFITISSLWIDHALFRLIDYAIFNDWLFNIYIPSLAVTIFLSGDLHSINGIIYFIAQLIQTFLMIYLVVMGTIAAFYYLRKRRGKPVR